MRIKTVKRYYCDHCCKGGFKKPSMRRHEHGCTRNPGRVCYLCEASQNYRDLTIQAKARSTPDEFRDDVRTINGADELGELADMVDGCPACLLAVLRQSNVMAFEHFDYKTELAAWHREQQPLMPYQ